MDDQRLAYAPSQEANNLNAKVLGNSGAMQITYPLDFPAGHNGQKPDVNLQYNSYNTREDGVVGYGWSLTVPYIERENRNGMATMYSSDDFTSSLDDSLVNTSGTSYAAKVEDGSFNAYDFSGGVWTMTDKLGNVYTFGATAASRMDDPANPAHVYRWYVSSVMDTNGNTINYTYFKDSGQIYPDTITYAGIYSISFGREPVYHPFAIYTPGFAVTTNYRINRIETDTSGAWTARTDMTYTSGTNGTRSLISTITDSGKDPLSGSIVVKPATTYTYQSVAHTTVSHYNFPTFSTDNPYWTSMGLTINFDPGVQQQAALVDVNGDGLPDIVSTGTDAGMSHDPTISWNYFPQVWINNGGGTWTHDTAWTFPVMYTDTVLGVPINYTFNLGNHSVKFADVNGDGLMDVIDTYQCFSGSSRTCYSAGATVFINTGSGWAITPSWDLPIIPGSSLSVEFDQYVPSIGDSLDPTSIQDVNGDGLPDIVYASGASSAYTSGISATTVLINTGTGWVRDPAWQIPSDGTIAPGDMPNFATNFQKADLLDVNGDGFPDIIDRHIAGSAYSCPTGTQAYYRNTHAGWTFDCFHIPNSAPGVDTQYADFNADGLPDVMRGDSTYGPSGVTSTSADTGIYPNQGDRWNDTFPLPDWVMPVTAVGPFGDHRTFGFMAYDFSGSETRDGISRIFDANADGLPDIADNGTVYKNEGNVLVADPATYDLAGSGFSSMYGDVTRPYDMNGDGIMDYAYSAVGDSSSYYVVTPGLKSDMLSGIQRNGVTTSVAYKETPITEKETGSDVSGEEKYAVVSIHTIPDVGLPYTETYSYSGGANYISADTGKKFAGFHIVTYTDPLGNVTKTYYHQGDATDAVNGEYADDYAKIGRVYRTEMYDGSENLYKVVVSKWDSSVPGTGREFVQLARTTTLTYDGGIAHRDTAQEYSYDGTNGNMTQKTDWGEVVAMPDGSFTDMGTDKSVETIGYAVPTSGSVIGAPSHDIVADQFGTTVRETRDYYDGLAFGSVTLGNQTKEEKLKSGTTYVNTQKTYGTDGFVTSSTDEDGNITSYTPDSYYLYPATVTDALTYAKNYLYDYALGKPSQITDENGFVYNTSYDGIGRVLTEYIPDPLSGASVQKSSYAYVDTPLANSIHETEYLGSGTAVDTYRYFDGLGRAIQTRVSSEVSGTYNISDTAYNSLGEKSRESLPYASAGSSRTAPTTTTALLTTYAYDPLGRMTSSTDADGLTTTTYLLWNTTVTGPMTGHIKEYRKDARENLVQVVEHNGSSLYTTAYAWDLNGKLTGMTDASGNVRAFTYDDLGRRLTAQDLHDPADTTFGVWTYAYDNAGNMTQSVSPNGATVRYAYDALNRRLSEDWTGHTGTEILYAYDSCPNGITKLCAVAMLSGTNTAYQYDADGNMTVESRTVAPSGSFMTQYAYDRQGNIFTIQYPDSATVQYTYGTNGQISKVKYAESGSPLGDVVSSINYSPMTQPSQIRYVNGVVTTNTYDASQLYRLSNKQTVNSSSIHLQDTAYSYDHDGDMTDLADTSANDNARTVHYTYDDLDRLLTANTTSVASGTPSYAESFTYDPIGNISSGPLGAYAYAGSAGTSYANPHAVTSTGTVSYIYDRDGNLLTSTDTSKAWNYVWNYKDQATEIDYGTATSQAAYDQDGNRVSNFWGAGTDYYPNKYYKLDQTGKITKDIYAGNELVATVETVGTAVTPYYIHTDHILGSNIATDSTGAQNQLLDYLPFGGVRLNEQTGAFNEEKQFGGHYYDDQQKLSYLGVRYYDPAMSRFVSEDPSFWDPERIIMNPQALNSYSYANENPIINIDPDGKLALPNVFGFIANTFKSLFANTPAVNSSNANISNASIQSNGIHVQPPGGFVSQKTSTGCFTACSQMVGYIPDPGKQIITSKFNDQGQLTSQAGFQQGINTINNYLENGKPIVVGVNWNGGSEEGNSNPATQHFVVIVGSNIDSKGKYYNFYDPGTSYDSKGTSSSNRLYIQGNELSGKSAYNKDTKNYIVTEVRP